MVKAKRGRAKQRSPEEMRERAAAIREKNRKLEEKNTKIRENEEDGWLCKVCTLESISEGCDEGCKGCLCLECLPGSINKKCKNPCNE